MSVGPSEILDMSVQRNSRDTKKRTHLSYKGRRELFDKYNIHEHFEPKPEIWPTQHRNVLLNVWELGDKITYREWRKDVYVDPSRPWRQETDRRAELIANLAQQGYGDDLSEEEWRRKLEHHIFFRFTLEVNCSGCTGRLWRSEPEVTVPLHDQFASRLSDRQKKRMNCSCSRSSQGPSKIFASQHSKAIYFEEDLSRDLGKIYEKPDAVYGLRRTGSIKSMLMTKYKQSADETIEKVITTTPFRDNPHTFFPFLVSESKSEKAGVTQREVKSQMAFITRKLLLIQGDLREHAGKYSRWKVEPLLWCVSHRGEDWRVSAAFMKRRESGEQFHFVDLWSGGITHKDGAIRLVLIMDHIFDWARDVYRRAIVAELWTLAVPSTPYHNLPFHYASSIQTETVVSNFEEGTNYLKDAENDLDFVEKQNRIVSWNRGNTGQITKFNDPSRSKNIKDSLGRYDSHQQVLRNAKLIRSHVLGIYITLDNLQILFKSTPTDEASKALFESILVRLEEEEPIFVNLETLIALETAWTGVDRGGSLESSNQEEEFQVLLTFSAYLNPNWEQTRELCFIAISQPAKERLHRIVRKDRYFKGYMRRRYRRSTCVHNTEIILKIIQFHLQASVQSNLMACLNRCSVMPKLTGKGRGTEESESDIFGNDQSNFSCSMNPYPERKSRNVVWSIYKSHRVGRNEPSSPLIHISSRWDEQKLDHKQNKRLPTPWTTHSISTSENLIVAYSKNPTNVSSISEVCAYLIDGARLERQLAELRRRERILTCILWTERLGTDSGWDAHAWNKIHDQRNVYVWKPTQNFLDYVVSVIQKEENGQFGDDEEDEGSSSSAEHTDEDGSSFNDDAGENSSSLGNDTEEDGGSIVEDNSSHSASSDETESENGGTDDAEDEDFVDSRYRRKSAETTTAFVNGTADSGPK